MSEIIDGREMIHFFASSLNAQLEATGARMKLTNLLKTWTAALLSLALPCRAQQYMLTDLGSGSGSAINNAGQVVVSSGSYPNYRAFVWRDGKITDLGTLPGDVASSALAINEAGQVVGYSYGLSGLRAVFWSDGTITDLGHPAWCQLDSCVGHQQSGSGGW